MRRALLVVIALSGVAAAEGKETKTDELVDVTAVVPDAVVAIPYATKDNFTGEVLVDKNVCKLHRKVAKRLARVADRLRADKRRLVMLSCYRPSSAQVKMWKLVPDPRYVAPPERGSNHSRGSAVDVAAADADGNALPTPTKFDDFTAAAHRGRAEAGDGEAAVEARRLEAAMRAEGFKPLATEWWHFDAPEKYQLSDEPL